MPRSETDHYLGNPLLKAAGVEQQFTQEEIKEYIKCSQDPIFFIKNYIQIVSLDKGLVPFELWDFQEEVVETVHNNRFVICKFPRQTGKSTTMIAYILHYVLFNDNMNVSHPCQQTCNCTRVVVTIASWHMKTCRSGYNRA